MIIDNEQIGRAFLNLIKNSIESIHEKTLKKLIISGLKIDIVITVKNDYIKVIIRR